MEINPRRGFVNRFATMAAASTGGQILFTQQQPPPESAASPSRAGDQSRRSNHTHNEIYYISGTGSNDGYPKDDHVFLTDPFEKHVVRTMDALKKSVERAGCTMDRILHLEVFVCLPHADNVPIPTG